MRRRQFLLEGGRAALGFCLLPQLTRAQGNQKRAVAKAPSVFPRKTIADLEELIPLLMREAVVPGLSIALVRDKKLLWHRGFGVKDNASGQPVDDHTVFEAASISKTVFAYAVMKLCEKGSLDLDTPLTRYTSERFLEGDTRLERITARHLLSHTGGFQDWRSGKNPLKIHFDPGTKFDYSGEGYFYLQSVLSRLTGRVDSTKCSRFEADLEVCATDFDAYMKRNLLDPFGMTASGYLWHQRFEKHAARPHDVLGKPFAKARPDAANVARYGSAGGLHTTAKDYARFLIEVVNPKPGNKFRLHQRSLQEMLRPHVKLPEGQKIDGADSWGLGWAIQERPTGHVILHSGGQSGFRSLAMASVERKSGFIMLTNGDNGAKVLYDQTLGDILNSLLAG